jgi:hypothetical protein
LASADNVRPCKKDCKDFLPILAQRPAAALPSSRQPAGLPRVERLKVTDVTGFTIPEINM